MTRPFLAADRWMFAPAPAERLAVLRILVGAFALAYLVVRLPAFTGTAARAPTEFAPVGLAVTLTGPLPAGVVHALLGVAVVAGAGFVAGAWFRVTGPLFALVVLALTTYRSSWGQLLHFENLMALHLLIVGFARSADALALGRHDRRPPDRPRLDGSGVAYGWPVRLAALVTVVTYVLAGLAKLRLGGASWIVGDTLRNHIAYSAARLDLLGGTPSPLARPLVARAWIFPPLAAATVLVELGAPIALLGGRVRNAWVAAAWLLHAGIAASMFVVFPYPLALVAFAPLFPLERIAAWFSDRRPHLALRKEYRKL